MRHRKAIRREHVGRPVDFLGADGKVYNGTIIEVRRRGVKIRYYVPQVMRECDACILNEQIGRVRLV